jgi:hypothetical protein
MLTNNIKNNFSQIASTTVGQKVEKISSKCHIFFFFDRNHQNYVYSVKIQYKNCIFPQNFAKKKIFFIKIYIFCCGNFSVVIFIVILKKKSQFIFFNISYYFSRKYLLKRHKTIDFDQKKH